jgi:hypothetical protein
METGRNAPCPCGSGRKYKKCCLSKVEPDRDQAWSRLGEAYDRLENRLRHYAEKTLGREGLREAYDEFLLWPEEESDHELLDRLGPLFVSWTLFNWVYDPDECTAKLDLISGLTPAELFLKKEANRLDETERQLIKAISGKPFSFFEVIRCDPGRGFLLKDVLTGEENEVLERSGSASARTGDILFCRVVRIQDMAMLYGCSSYIIPPDRKPAIIELRKSLGRNRKKITERILKEYDFEIREEYLDISQSLFHLPVILNTDGDPMNVHTIHYEIDSPDLAFSRLSDLCVTESEETLRSAAQLDAEGGIVHIEIPWTRKGYRKNSALENTILGSLVIEGRNLKVTVNSAERAERIRKEIETRLGKGAKYKTTVFQSTEYMLQKQREVPHRDAAAELKNEELMQHPEVREKLAEVLAAHWIGWIDEKVPALGGKTPRQAVKNADGRESVEALLLSAERNTAEDKHMRETILKIIHNVRQRIGLVRS